MDYYSVLGVARDAGPDDIKRAYRRLARKYHPDVSDAEDAHQRFQEVSEAYQVLKDEESRALYDQYGEHWKQVAEGAPPPGGSGRGPRASGRHQAPPGGGFRGFRDEAEYRSIFEDLFGAGPSTSGWRFDQRGEDFEVPLKISLERAYSGGKERVSLRTPRVGDDGRIVHTTRTLDVTIPKGVIAGQRLRLSGQGGEGSGQGRAGDLYAVVEFLPHPVLRADGADIHLDLPVTASEAALGAKVKVPTLGGTVSVTVPKGARTDQVLRLKGRGLPAKKGAGDQLLHLKVIAPAADSDEKAELYRRLAELETNDPRAPLGV